MWILDQTGFVLCSLNSCVRIEARDDGSLVWFSYSCTQTLGRYVNKDAAGDALTDIGIRLGMVVTPSKCEYDYREEDEQ